MTNSCTIDYFIISLTNIKQNIISIINVYFIMMLNIADIKKVVSSCCQIDEHDNETTPYAGSIHEGNSW